MKIYKFIFGIAALMSLLLTSCNDWFDVTSSNEIREKDHYSSDNGFKQSLIGCYLKMGETDLYGMNLSWFMPDYIANQTRLVSQGSASEAMGFQVHNYKATQTRSACDAIWSSAYNVIVNANEALKNMEGKESSMNEINYHVIKGELLAVRALMHFDLLRLYGYGNWAARKAELDAKATIPYVTTVDKNMTAQATGAEVFADLENDLTQSIDLLKDYDPACGVHDKAYYTDVNSDGFYNRRNTRLNYYAVEALLAQVYMWEGSADSRQKALALCNDIIDKLGGGRTIIWKSDRGGSDNTFVLNLSTAASLSNATSSLIGEALFAENVNNLSQILTNYIRPAYADANANAIYLTSSQMKDIYDDSSTPDDESIVDVRATKLLSVNTESAEAGYVPVKFYQDHFASSSASYYGNKIPVIRLPEVYLMAAECQAAQGNVDEAEKLVNHIREARGLYTPLAGLTAEQMQAEIGKEYRKEFLGEGEIFYYYKRTGAVSIPNFPEMTDNDYLLPYPDIETASGRIQ